jgi:hypothetical protein
MHSAQVAVFSNDNMKAGIKIAEKVAIATRLGMGRWAKVITG